MRRVMKNTMKKSYYRALIFSVCVAAFMSTTIASDVYADNKSSTLGDVIFKCKGEKGRVVFQQTPCDEKDISGSGPAHMAWRDMKELSERGKNILALLGANVESIKRCNHDIEIYRKRIAAKKSLIRQVSREHPLIKKAYSYIKDCAECRTSAESHCRTADDYLIKATSKLGQ